MMTKSEKKLELPAFLKVLSNGDMPMSRAMAFAAKVYKTHNAPSELGKLTDDQLMSMGVENKEDRKLALAAIKKAGYKPTVRDPVSRSNATAGPSKASLKAKAPRKRKRDDDLNKPPPSGSASEGHKSSEKFGFNEVLNEEELTSKSAVVNRAPVMTAWATVVAERLGFKREEALSIASAYTEMNAISKGMSIGVFDKSKGEGIELTKDQSQPYVDLMGRRPIYTTKSDEYRALLKGEPVDPSTPFSYITRSFRQTLPFVIGSMRLLAETFEPAELNKKGYGLYMEFRPDVEHMGKKGWGERAEMRCTDILKLRKIKPKTEGGLSRDDGTKIKAEKGPDKPEEPPEKRAKNMSVEEYEAALDASMAYDDLKFDDDF